MAQDTQAPADELSSQEDAVVPCALDAAALSSMHTILSHLVEENTTMRQDLAQLHRILHTLHTELHSARSRIAQLEGDTSFQADSPKEQEDAKVESTTDDGSPTVHVLSASKVAPITTSIGCGTESSEMLYTVSCPVEQCPPLRSPSITHQVDIVSLPQSAIPSASSANQRSCSPTQEGTLGPTSQITSQAAARPQTGAPTCTWWTRTASGTPVLFQSRHSQNIRERTSPRKSPTTSPTRCSSPTSQPNKNRTSLSRQSLNETGRRPGQAVSTASSVHKYQPRPPVPKSSSNSTAGDSPPRLRQSVGSGRNSPVGFACSASPTSEINEANHVQRALAFPPPDPTVPRRAAPSPTFASGTTEPARKTAVMAQRQENASRITRRSVITPSSGSPRHSGQSVAVQATGRRTPTNMF